MSKMFREIKGKESNQHNISQKDFEDDTKLDSRILPYNCLKEHVINLKKLKFKLPILVED